MPKSGKLLAFAISTSNTFMPNFVKITELEDAINAIKKAHLNDSPVSEGEMKLMATLYGIQIYERASQFDLDQQPAAIQSLLNKWLSLKTNTPTRLQSATSV